MFGSREIRYVVVVAAASIVMADFAGAQDEDAGLRIEYSNSPDAPIVEYDIESMIGRADLTPRLRIYGDGRVRVHYPAYMTTAGEYEMKLSEAEVAALLRDLHDNGAMSFDEKAVDQARRAAESARAARAQSSGEALEYRSDVATTIIRIRLDAYRSSAAAEMQTDLRKEIRCADLQHDASAHPEITPLQGMANVENLLVELTRDGRLRKVAETR